MDDDKEYFISRVYACRFTWRVHAPNERAALNELNSHRPKNFESVVRQEWLGEINEQFWETTMDSVLEVPEGSKRAV